VEALPRLHGGKIPPLLALRQLETELGVGKRLSC
jgi:hypothetical protein